VTPVRKGLKEPQRGVRQLKKTGIGLQTSERDKKQARPKVERGKKSMEREGWSLPKDRSGLHVSGVDGSGYEKTEQFVRKK